MARTPTPRRYAQAVFQIAQETGDHDAWVEDLRVLAAALESGDFASLLDAPQVPAARKFDAIKEAFGDSVTPLAVNLISLLASRISAHLVPAILEQYDGLVDAHRGIERAEVVSAVTLDGERQAKIAELLEGIVGGQVRLTTFVEPHIIGGMIATVGDRVVDGSVRTKLTEMRRSIVEQIS